MKNLLLASLVLLSLESMGASTQVFECDGELATYKTVGDSKQYIGMVNFSGSEFKISEEKLIITRSDDAQILNRETGRAGYIYTSKALPFFKISHAGTQLNISAKLSDFGSEQGFHSFEGSLSCEEVITEIVEVYNCPIDQKELNQVSMIVTFKGDKTTLSAVDRHTGYIYINEADCDLLSLQSNNSNLTCDDQAGDSLNATLDHDEMDLETILSWSTIPFSGSCTKS